MKASCHESGHAKRQRDQGTEHQPEVATRALLARGDFASYAPELVATENVLRMHIVSQLLDITLQFATELPDIALQFGAEFIDIALQFNAKILDIALQFDAKIFDVSLEFLAQASEIRTELSTSCRR